VKSRIIPMAIAFGFGLGAQAAPVTYDDIAPVLGARCVMCHNGPAAPRGLRLDSYDALVKGGERGPVARSGDAAGSELIRRLTGQSQPRMPMTGPPFLTDAEVALFEQWVAGGMQRGGAKPSAAPAPARLPGPGEAVTYAHVAPILATRCAKCHTDNGIMGPAPEGYRLTSYEATLSPADRVRVIPGNPAASELLRRVKGQSQPRMPFDGPPFLSDEEIRVIEAWIAGGARSASGQPAKIPVGARVRLQGVLEPDWRLDGLPLVVDGARIDKRPRTGDYIEVRASVGPQGEIVAERIRRR
jgi:mono/diheme cytochrome c family protein